GAKAGKGGDRQGVETVVRDVEGSERWKLWLWGRGGFQKCEPVAAEIEVPEARKVVDIGKTMKIVSTEVEI
ncbi:MAG: hypothetical protein Q9190_005269, partial [Brigantiaea leucoxantha]